MSNLVSNRSTRNPTEIEKNIIHAYAKHLRYQYIEMFILLLIVEFFICFVIYEAFSRSFLDILFMGGFMIILFLIISVFSLISLYMIRETKRRSYTVVIDKGNCSIKTIIGERRQEQFLQVNEKEIGLIHSYILTKEKMDNKTYIEYEYVEVTESYSLFGYQNIFTSINNQRLTEKDEKYMKQLKYVGVLSLILTPVFCVLLIFIILIDFKDEQLNYICLGLFILFLRTIFSMIYNKRLRNKLKEKNINL